MIENSTLISTVQNSDQLANANPEFEQNQVALFGESMSKADSKHTAMVDSVKAAVKPLDDINAEASNIFKFAKEAVASGSDLTPSEIITLTAKSQEFMFHCQLTSNIANRTSDGIQQLFRQQN